MIFIPKIRGAINMMRNVKWNSRVYYSSGRFPMQHGLTSRKTLVGAFGCGVGLGVLFHKYQKSFKEQDVLKKYMSKCAPTLTTHTPLRFTMPITHDPRFAGWHKFIYTSTSLSVNINQQSCDLVQAKNRSFNDWEQEAMKLLGQYEYGYKKVHHVLLTTPEQLYNDLSPSPNDRIRYLSKEHTNWIWLQNYYTVVTFIWDEDVGHYRYYIKPDCTVLLECDKDCRNNLTVPLSIKYFSDEMKPICTPEDHTKYNVLPKGKCPPLKYTNDDGYLGEAGGYDNWGDPIQKKFETKDYVDDIYIKEIIEKFDDDFLKIQQEMKFVY